MRMAMVALMLAALLAAGCREDNSGPTRSAPATRASRASAPAELSCLDGYAEIYLIDVDGAGLRKLTHGWEKDIVWSPDGSRIAFHSRGKTERATEDWFVDVIDADRGNRVRLTRTSIQSDSKPAWSPDGSRLAVSAFRKGPGDLGSGPVMAVDSVRGRVDICLMAPDGTGKVYLEHFGEDYHPRWSTDGARIALTALTRTGWHTYVTDARPGGQVRQVKKGQTPFGQAREPAARPGLRIEGGNVWAVRADGARTRLTKTADVVAGAGAPGPGWSPDGSKIALVRRASEFCWSLWVMGADGSDQVRLTRGEHCVREFAWSPDGSRIAFTAGDPPIYRTGPPEPPE